MVIRYMIGYDLDGTLCDRSPKRDKPSSQQTVEEQAEYDWRLRQHYRNAVLTAKPEEPFVVISGRCDCYEAETLTWLAEHELHPIAVELLHGARTKANRIAHKLAKCTEYGVQRYYDDDEEIARALSAAGITVILITGASVDGVDE